MRVCKKGHKQICFEGNNDCPLCDMMILQSILHAEIKDLDKRVEELEDDLERAHRIQQ